MMEGLIYPLDENYRFLVSEYMDGPIEDRDGEPLTSLDDLFEETYPF